MEEFVLTTPYITLGQLLKAIGVIDTGGQAKRFLQERDVRVNGKSEIRRGRKLETGDRVAVAGWGTVKLIDRQ